MKGIKIKDLMTGKFSQTFFRRYMLFMAGIFGSILTTAIFTFPGYTFFDYSISALGSLIKNPNGWLLFSIAMWAQAFLVIPFFTHVWRVFKTYTPKLSILFLCAVVMTVMGLIMLGFFPEDPSTSRMHYYSAGFAFGGFFIAACLSWATMGFMISRAPDVKRKKSIIISIPIMVVAFGFAIFGTGTAFYATEVLAVDFGLLTNLFFWEWMFFSAIGVYILVLEIIISREILEVKK